VLAQVVVAQKYFFPAFTPGLRKVKRVGNFMFVHFMFVHFMFVTSKKRT
jgi:hypothetical protein